MKRFFEFQEIDVCGSCDGRIIVASINTKKGLIIYQKENIPISQVDDFLALPQISGIGIYGWQYRHRKGEERKPRRENLKTISERKRQRLNRALLGQLKKSILYKEPLFD